MKKLLLAVLISFSFAMAANSQSLFKEGDKIINVGIGFGTRSNLVGTKSVVPPINASFELGVKDNLFDENSSLGIGGFLAYYSQKLGILGDYGFKYSNFVIGARGLVHYKLVDKLDTYGGLMLGYDISSSKVYGEDMPTGLTAASAGGFAYSIFAGARYYFSDNTSAFVELGYGVTVLNLGISFRL